MKKATTTAILLWPLCLAAQWLQTGGSVTIAAGVNFITPGDVQVQGGTLRNASKLYCQSLGSAPAATVRGSGSCFVRKNLSILGTLTDAQTFVLQSESPSLVSGGASPLKNLWLEKTSGAAVVNLASGLSIGGQLRFVNADNKLQLNGHNLTLLPSASIAGVTSGSFIVTNDTGMVVRQNLGSAFFRFPVGASPETYNPLEISNIGTSDHFAVRCLPDVLENGSSGAALTSDAAAVSWQVTETAPGGSNLTLRAGWFSPDNLPNFTPSSCALRRHDGGVWQAAPLGPASGTNPIKRTRAGLTELGYFAVLDGSTAFQNLDDRENSGEASASVFPNPASDFARLRLAGDAFSQNLEIQLFNSEGRLLRQLQFSSPEEVLIPVLELPSGNYRAEVFGKDSRAVAWFVKI